MSEYEITLSYEERSALKREIKLLHRAYVENRLKKQLPVRLVIAFAGIIALVGIVELVLQVLLIVNSGPLYFVGHGIWGGILSFAYVIICLLLVKKRTFEFYVASILVGMFFFAATVAAFTAIPFASVQIAGDTCSTRSNNRNQEECQSSQLGIVLTMAIVGVLSNILTLGGIIALPLFASRGFSSKQMQQQVDNQLNIVSTSQPRQQQQYHMSRPPVDMMIQAEAQKNNRTYTLADPSDVTF